MTDTSRVKLPPLSEKTRCASHCRPGSQFLGIYGLRESWLGVRANRLKGLVQSIERVAGRLETGGATTAYKCSSFCRYLPWSHFLWGGHHGRTTRSDK